MSALTPEQRWLAIRHRPTITEIDAISSDTPFVQGFGYTGAQPDWWVEMERVRAQLYRHSFALTLLPTGVEVPVGHYVLADVNLRFIKVAEYLTNGLGFNYRCVAPGRFIRVNF